MFRFKLKGPRLKGTRSYKGTVPLSGIGTGNKTKNQLKRSKRSKKSG